MIKNEWKLIAKNKFLWLVMLALVLIPVLYNVIFLSSLWDPYGKIQDLPVAVVNEDKSATLNGKKVTLGADLSENLKKSKTLDYSFVSADKAKNGLADGRYYMVVTFPEDLSSSASSIMDKTPKKATIRYETSKGHNFISSKMSESAMEKLQLSVTQDITKQYATTIFDNLSNLKTGMATAADGAGKLATGSSQAKSGSAQLSSGLTTAASSMLTFTNGAKQLSSGLTDYTNGVATLGQGTQQLSSGGAQLTTGAEKLAQGVQQLSDATTLSDAEKTQLAQLSSGLTAFNDGIQNGSGNAAQLTALLSDMAANAQAILSAEAAQTQAVHATSAYQSLTAPQQSEIDTALTQNSGAASAQKILQDVQNLSAALTTLQTNQTQLQQSAAQLLPAANTALGNLSTGLASAHTALATQIVPAAETLAQGSGQLSTGLNQLTTGAQQLTAKNSQLTNAAAQLTTGSEQISTGTTQLAAGSSQLTDALTQLTTGTNQLKTPLVAASSNLNQTNTNAANATTLASNTTLVHADTDKVAANGVGMAPYMISVALFVGALSTNVIIGRSISDERKAKNRRDFLLAKLATNGVIAVAQGILVTLGVLLIGLRPAHFMTLLLGNILIAFAFMSLITFFNLWLGKVGAFLMLILLMAQLATSAGTYPIQLTGGIFEALNPWLPMTYTVLYLRQAISLTGNVGSYVFLLLALALVFTLLIPLTHKRTPRFD